MSKTKTKAKRKYNPNRKSAVAVQALQQQAAERRKYAEDIEYTYELEMEFTSNAIDKFVKEQRALEIDYINRFPNRNCDPYDILIGAYGYQDLAIALVLEHLKTPEKWILAADGHFVNLDDPDCLMISFEYRQEVPNVPHQDLWHGNKECLIDMGNGLKRKGWKGLQAEMIEVFQEQADKQNLPDGYSLEEIQVHIATEAQFKSATTYQEFLEVQKWVEQGTAKAKLRTLWQHETMVQHVKSMKKYGLIGSAA